MNKNSPKPLYLYSVSLPLVLLLLLAVGGGIYFYLNYNNSLKLSQNNLQNEITNRIQQKKEDLSTVVISEEQLNQMIKDQAVGKGIGESTLESATATIVNDEINIDGLMADGTKIYTVIGMSDDGQGVFIKELTLTDAGIFASVKETLLRTFLKVTIENLLKSGDDSGFVSAEITQGQITIYFDQNE
jgi:hypothetical protein